MNFDVLFFLTWISIQLLQVNVSFLTNVFPGLKWPPLFANFSLMVILIEKLIREMNLDIYRVIEFILST